MGSCCSTTANSETTQKLDQHSPMAAPIRAPRSDDRSPTLESRAPPPTLDEETVKEVVLSVSQTPKLRPKPPKHEPQEQEKIAITMASPSPVFSIFKLDGDEKRPRRSPSEEISEMSEIESVSTTTNLTNDDNDDEIGRARAYRSPMKLPKNRSFSGEVGAAGRRERFVAGRSPSLRSDQSPGRKTGNGLGSVRIVQSRDLGRAGPRNGWSPAPEKRFGRDSGEGSGRRSRSPAMNRTDSGGARRSPSARRAVRSPGRINGAPTGKACRRDEENDESLDNPLVSLECFIFL